MHSLTLLTEAPQVCLVGPAEAPLIIAVPPRLIPASKIARGNLDVPQRAALARAWIDNRVVVGPSTELASKVFAVSRRSIGREPRAQASLPMMYLLFGWTWATPKERTRFVAQLEPQIWTTLESVTDDQR